MNVVCSNVYFTKYPIILDKNSQPSSTPGQQSTSTPMDEYIYRERERESWAQWRPKTLESVETTRSTVKIFWQLMDIIK